MEPLVIHAIARPPSGATRPGDPQSVGLQAHHFDRYPHELSEASARGSCSPAR